MHGGIAGVAAFDLNDIRAQPGGPVLINSNFMQLSFAPRHRNLCPSLARALRFRAHYSSSPLLSQHPTICPSCRAPLPTRLLACPKCFHIEHSHPGKNYDYYDLLETPKCPNPFIVNESRLKNNFRRVQRYVHPDVWAKQGEVHNTTLNFSYLFC